MKKATSVWLKRLPLYFVLTVILVLTVLPLLWMISTSFKTTAAVTAIPPQFIPSPIRWSNYPKALASAPFGLFFFNSFKITVLVMIGLTMISALGGYGFARFDFPLKGFLFGLLLAAMMVPYAMLVVPLYSMFRTLGWLDHHVALIVPPIMANTFSTFLFRQYFRSIPKELDEAAIIDGASPFGIFARILMPLAAPAVATVAVFAFMNNWNSFLPPLIYLQSTAKFTVTVGLSVFQGQFATHYQLLMAVATLAILPILGVYLWAQKYFIRGVVTSGLKS